MKVAFPLGIREQTWQAAVTGALWGWEFSMMHESSYSYRKGESKMSEGILNSNSKSFLGKKHEIPAEVRVVCVFGLSRG